MYIYYYITSFVLTNNKYNNLGMVNMNYMVVYPNNYFGTQYQLCFISICHFKLKKIKNLFNKLLMLTWYYFIVDDKSLDKQFL